MQGFKLSDHLPAPLLTDGPLGLEVWQWLALVGLIPASLGIGLLLERPTRWLLKRVALKTRNEYDDALMRASQGPIILLWAALASRVLLLWVELPSKTATIIGGSGRLVVILALAWLLMRIIRVLQFGLPGTQWAVTRPALRSIIPLVARIARIFVLAAAILAIVASFGFEIGTILAGVGIGGIAIALGAQKSLEHFFGSVSIGIDQPFRVGDWVAAEGVAGTVEAIGLRSTQFRTIDRTLVTIPNGKLAEAKSENYGARDRIRFRTSVGLEYGTPAATIRSIRDELEVLLRAHAKVWQDNMTVRFVQLGASSLDIEVFCWIETTSIDDFRVIQEELLLGVMEVVEGHGASFAFPTQKLHLTGDAPALRPPAQPL